MRGRVPAADPLALRNAYQSGVITNAGGGLRLVPIIDVRPTADRLPEGDTISNITPTPIASVSRRRTHLCELTSMLVTSVGHLNDVDAYALAKMDGWLTNLQKDSSFRSRAHQDSACQAADLATPAGIRTASEFYEQRPSAEAVQHLVPHLPRTAHGRRWTAGEQCFKCQLKPST